MTDTMCVTYNTKHEGSVLAWGSTVQASYCASLTTDVKCICVEHKSTYSHFEMPVQWSGAGVAKKSPLANFEVSFVYNFESIPAIIMEFGTRFRR